MNSLEAKGAPGFIILSGKRIISMSGITFYTKPGCHLCEDGQWILEIALRGRELPVSYIDISASATLIDRYGRRIPVLSHPNLAAELDWPFTPETILAWLDS